jgi:hypothetical protein
MKVSDLSIIFKLAHWPHSFLEPDIEIFLLSLIFVFQTYFPNCKNTPNLMIVIFYLFHQIFKVVLFSFFKNIEKRFLYDFRT